MIEVIITSTNYVISATEVSNNITVISDNSLFTVTSVVNNFTITSITPIITFDTEGADFDFASKHRGEWVSGTDYTRNDVVRYENSIYICSIPYDQSLNSTTPPPDDVNNWELFYWNQWTKQYLTVTNFLNVGGPISVGSTATFAGNVNIAGTATIGGDITVDEGTFRNLAVSNQFSINGLNYPISRGVYGQILSTNGTSSAYWVNISDLTFWNLSTDLQTNGFNIVTGREDAVPNPQLTIGSGETGNFISFLNFATGGHSVELRAPNLELTNNNDIEISYSSASDSISLRANDIEVTGNLRVNGNFGRLTGQLDADPIRLGPGGILFDDGTVQTTAGGGTGTFTLTQIASASRLGVIRVGQYLTINSSTGVLSVDAYSLPNTYTLPAATANTRGGIRVGNGLTISDTDVLNVSTSTEYGNVSLTQDMRTNGYKIIYGGTGTSYVDVNNDNLEIYAEEVNINGDDVIIDSVNNMQLKAPITIIGDDIYNTRLHVGRIYNFSGVGPPLFPAGIQFDDQTVQITAYDDGRFDNGDLDELPYFTNNSWQALITYLVNIDFLDPRLVWSEEDLG